MSLNILTGFLPFVCHKPTQPGHPSMSRRNYGSAAGNEIEHTGIGGSGVQFAYCISLLRNTSHKNRSLIWFTMQTSVIRPDPHLEKVKKSGNFKVVREKSGKLKSVPSYD